MNKFQVLKLMEANGDSTLTLRGEPDIVATIDFQERYIKRKRYGKYPIEKQSVLVFSWTDDKFRNINVENIKSIKPLSATLENPSYGEERKSW